MAFAHVSRPERYACPNSTAFPTLKDTGLKAFHGYVKQIDGMLAEREWFSDRYTVLDPYGFVFYTWGFAASSRWESSRTTQHLRTG